MEGYMRRVGGIALMALVVFAKAAFYTHAFFNLERVSVSAYKYVTGYNAHKLGIDPKDGRSHHA
jgi:hypothetical protein